MPFRKGLVVLCTVLAMVCSAPVLAQAPQPARAVLVTQSKGFEHDVVKEPNGQPSLVEKTLRDIADKSITGKDIANRTIGTRQLSSEAVNNLIKRIKRIGFGFRRFAHYRLRVLLYAGRPNWDRLATITPITPP